MARIRHLAILTEDVERMVKFYINSFGLEIVEGEGTATYLTDGHINLAIIPIGPVRKALITLVSKLIILKPWFQFVRNLEPQKILK